MDEPAPVHEPDDWQPATSRPGEVLTVEGRIAAIGAFARGLKHRDQRASDYRRSMMRIVYGCLAVCAVILTIAAVVG